MIDSDSTEYYYTHDHLHSPAVLLTLGGTIHERYEYDAYGNPTIYTGDGGDGNWFDGDETSGDSSALGNPYLFTGRRVDFLDSNDLVLQYNRNRYYDYYAGRWLTQDPLGYVDGMSLYEYAEGQPVSGRDSFGLKTCEACEYLHGKYCKLKERGVQYKWRLGGADVFSLTSVSLDALARVTTKIALKAVSQMASNLLGALPSLDYVSWVEVRGYRKEKYAFYHFKCTSDCTFGSGKTRKRIEGMKKVRFLTTKTRWFKSELIEKNDYTMQLALKDLLRDNRADFQLIAMPSKACRSEWFICKKGEDVRKNGATHKCENFTWKNERSRIWKGMTFVWESE